MTGGVLKLTNVKIKGFHSAVSMTSGWTLEGDGLSIEGANIAIEVRDESSGDSTDRPIYWIDLLAVCFATLRLSKGRSSDERSAAFLASAVSQGLPKSLDLDRLLKQLFYAEEQGFSLEHLMSPRIRGWLDAMTDRPNP